MRKRSLKKIKGGARHLFDELLAMDSQTPPSEKTNLGAKITALIDEAEAHGDGGELVRVLNILQGALQEPDGQEKPPFLLDTIDPKILQSTLEDPDGQIGQFSLVEKVDKRASIKNESDGAMLSSPNPPKIRPF